MRGKASRFGRPISTLDATYSRLKECQSPVANANDSLDRKLFSACAAFKLSSTFLVMRSTIGRESVAGPTASTRAQSVVAH